jgi:hypothetical protein
VSGNIGLAAGSTITAYQGGAPWLTNASIVGVPSVNASIAGTVPITGNVGLVPGATLTAYQGTNPWATTASIVGTVPVTASLLSPVTVTLPGAVTVTQPPPITVRYGQALVVSSAYPVTLSTQIVNAAVIQALAGNVTTVVIGDANVSMGNGFQLQAGQATGLAISNMNKVFVNGVIGDGVCWIGS